jgi:hypothetical protein
MKILTTMLITFALSVLIASACGLQNHSLQNGIQSNRISSEGVAPIIHLEVSSSIKLEDPLEVHWRIFNNTTEPIYIYSTLLQHASFADFDIDAKQKIIEIHFLRLSLWGEKPPPYYFPPTEFSKIDPGQELKGKLVSGKSIGQLVSYKSSDGKTEEEKIKPGTWTIRALVAYGREIESVQKDLIELQKKGKGHPADPVVRWQKISQSELVSVIVE